jgi:hypothetical protein
LLGVGASALPDHEPAHCSFRAAKSMRKKDDARVGA